MVPDPRHCLLRLTSAALLFTSGLLAANDQLPDSGHCAALPRPANAALPAVETDSDWFEVYEAAAGVLAIVEPYQFQEVISYLITGRERAILFDSGLGMAPIRPLVERLTDRPVTVINSHTHFDHVGGNHEFDDVLAVDNVYTRANQGGVTAEKLAAEAAREAFCREPPAAVVSGEWRTKAWRASGKITDGMIIDLGGRTIEILQVPGHTPDALALFDPENGLLWTGDSYYDGQLWLFVPETRLDDYLASMERLVALLPSVRQLLPAHNTASVAPRELRRATEAIAILARDGASNAPVRDGQIHWELNGIRVLTAPQVLNREYSDPWRGRQRPGPLALSGRGPSAIAQRPEQKTQLFAQAVDGRLPGP